MEDHEIVRRVKKGETELYEILVRRYEKKLCALGWRMLHNRADVEDAVQEAFMKAYRSLSRFRGDAQFSTWIYRITVNLILNRIRKYSKMKEIDLDTDKIQGADNPRASARRSELKLATARAIAELPPRQRAIFHMRYEEGRPHAEIARVLGLSEGAVKSSYHHAVFKLRESLREFVE
ncbi:sigma-70 family RNA polymerase sigma factor [candidate division WOR-3 bacterium]|uniref:Sigma-70 family RNA polymerase sigma factor n=1 Tax=candidate division WOR-3 bacterium TaxID=2052148 RepID=A0A9D5KAN1_UNCW3|nr:sigma-70 family RNA polymerase sigma factor [candidate division WOR-3 bacterium]MBD3365572.1 sigma-70 family RNA polymerase sigma factor [candidate division WOR-3 bacterium]